MLSNSTVELPKDIESTKINHSKKTIKRSHPKVGTEAVTADKKTKTHPIPSKKDEDEDDETKPTAGELPSHYEIISFCGSGSYGLVYKGLDTKKNHPIAIKKVTGIFDRITKAKRFYREIKILGLLNAYPHPNIIPLKNIIRPTAPKATFNDVNLVFEFCETDLHELLNKDINFTISQVKLLIYQILCGLQHIHSLNIAHRDLKPANILVNNDLTLKICDFGLSRSLEIMNICSATPASKPRLLRSLTRHVVTRWYRSPEIILLTDLYGPALDIWSAGCILAELLMMIKETGYTRSTRRAFFPGSTCFPHTANAKDDYNSSQDQLNLIFDIMGTPTSDDLQCIDNLTARHFIANLEPKKPINLAKKFPGVDQQAIDLLKKLLEFNPAKRISAKDALKHPFLKNMADNNNMEKNLVLNEEQKVSLQEYYQFEIELETQLTLPADFDHEAKTQNNTNLEDFEIQERLRKYTELEKLKLSDSHATKNMEKIRDLVILEIDRYEKETAEIKIEPQTLTPQIDHSSSSPTAPQQHPTTFLGRIKNFFQSKPIIKSSTVNNTNLELDPFKVALR